MNCGDDVRYRPIQVRLDYKYLNFKFLEHSIEERKIYKYGSNTFLKSFFNQWIEEKSGAKIISLRSQATFQNKPLYQFRFPVKKILDKEKNASKLPLIIHAPTNRNVKGTKFVLEAIERLKKSNLKFEFELVEGKSNAYVLDRLKESDIVIDQPSSWIGRYAVEAMAAGCVIVGGNRADYQGFCMKSPVIQFETDGNYLFDKLENLIVNKEKRDLLMKDSYEFWKNYYSYESFAEYFESIINGSAVMFKPLNDNKKIIASLCSNYRQRFIVNLLI